MRLLQKRNPVNCVLMVAAFCMALPCMMRADAETDWKNITAMDAGPKGNAKTRDEALQLTLQHFAVLEKALRAFIADYPGDAHGVDARLRLSHLLAIRSDMDGNPKEYAAARKTLEDLEASPALPPGKLPDVEYARITLFMHHAVNPDQEEREALLSYVRKFQKDFPADHRNGALLAEMASLYDSDPDQKHELLDEAFRYADTDELKERINDDLKRLGMLGKPLELKFESVQGEQVDMESYRGKVVLVYFFAGWSPPSALGLAEVKGIADDLPKGEFQVVGISLDKTKEAMLALTGKAGLGACPVFFDGKGWESPLVRSLGINELPTVWLVDKKGNLHVLNAVNNTEGLVRQLLREE
jgi:thiol-disulfide isomerase/thioredoxin